MRGIVSYLFESLSVLRIESNHPGDQLLDLVREEGREVRPAGVNLSEQLLVSLT